MCLDDVRAILQKFSRKLKTEVANFTILQILKANAQKGIKINLSYPLRSKTDIGASYA